MSGRGGVTYSKWDGTIPPECQPNPMIRRLSANVTWEEAQEPLHIDIDVNSTCGVGPGMPYAHSILKRDPAGTGVIGLVPCAVGNTSISEWSRGYPLNDQLLFRAKAAGGAIRAILWYQGEADTRTPESADMYKSRFQTFITDVRSDLQSPLLPVIEVALASGNNNYIEIVRKAQVETAAELPNAAGLQLGPDRVYLTTAAQLQPGLIMADAFLQSHL